jgi:hypothetical protein
MVRLASTCKRVVLAKRSMTELNTTYSDNFVLLLVVLHYGDSLLHEGSESFLDALDVVVRAATGLASLQQALLHHLFRAVEEQQEWNLDLAAQLPRS